MHPADSDMDYWVRQLQDFIGVRNRSRRDRVPQERGYDCTFVEAPLGGVQSTKCQICNFVLREPTQLRCCGGLYCAGCISTRQACPKCRQPIPASFPDTRIKQWLMGLQVYCVHKGERRDREGEGGGCDWVGKLGELDRHLNKNLFRGRMNGCLHTEIKCRFCENSFKRLSVEDHQSNHCPKRPYPCPHCQHNSTYIDITEHHPQDCPSVPTECQYCKKVFKRSKIEHHIKNDCAAALVDCDFHLVGCRKRFLRPQIEAHIDDNRAQHARLLAEYAKGHPNDRLKHYLPMLKSTLTELADENESLKKWKEALATVVAVLVLLIAIYIFY